MMDLIVYCLARTYCQRAAVGDRIPPHRDLGVDLRVRDTCDQIAKGPQFLGDSLVSCCIASRKKPGVLQVWALTLGVAEATKAVIKS